MLKKENNISDSKHTENLYLNFRLKQHEFAIGIDHVSQVIGRQCIVSVPKRKPYIRGVFTWHEEVITALDAQGRLFGVTNDADNSTYVIILNYKNTKMGLLVEEIGNVIEIEKNNIKTTTGMTLAIDKEVIAGVAENDNQPVLILAIEKLLKDKVEDKVAQEIA